MANSELTFVARLDPQASIDKLVNEDLPKIEQGVDAKGEPKFIAHLDIDKTAENISKELAQVGKALKLDFGKVIGNNQKGAKNVSKAIAEQVYNLSDLNKAKIKYFRNATDMEQLRKNIMSTISRDGGYKDTATIKYLMDEENQIKKVILSYQNMEQQMVSVDFVRKRTGEGKNRRIHWVADAEAITEGANKASAAYKQMQESVNSFHNFMSKKTGTFDNSGNQVLQGSLGAYSGQNVAAIDKLLEKQREYDAEVLKIREDENLSYTERLTRIKEYTAEKKTEIGLIEKAEKAGAKLTGTDMSQTVEKSILAVERLKQNVEKMSTSLYGSRTGFREILDVDIKRLEESLLNVTDKASFDKFVLQLTEVKNKINELNKDQKAVKFSFKIDDSIKEIERFKESIMHLVPSGEVKQVETRLNVLKQSIRGALDEGSLKKYMASFNEFKRTITEKIDVSKSVEAIRRGLEVTDKQLHAMMNSSTSLADGSTRNALERESFNIKNLLSAVTSQADLDYVNNQIAEFEKRLKILNISIKENVGKHKLKIDVEDAQAKLDTFVKNNQDVISKAGLTKQFAEVRDHITGALNPTFLSEYTKELGRLITQTDDYNKRLKLQEDTLLKIKGIQTTANINSKDVTDINGKSRRNADVSTFNALNQELTDITAKLNDFDKLSLEEAEKLSRRVNAINSELQNLYKTVGNRQHEAIFSDNTINTLDQISAKANNMTGNLGKDAELLSQFETEYKNIYNQILAILNAPPSKEGEAEITRMLGSLKNLHAEYEKMATQKISFTDDFITAGNRIDELGAKIKAIQVSTPQGGLSNTLTEISNRYAQLLQQFNNVTEPQALVNLERELSILTSDFNQFNTALKEDQARQKLAQSLSKDVEKLRALRAELTKVGNNLSGYDVPYTNLITKINSMLAGVGKIADIPALNNFETQMANIESEVKRFQTSISDTSAMSKLATQGENLAIKIETFIQSNTRLSGTAKQNLEGLAQSARNVTSSLDLGRINTQFQNMQMQLRSANQLGKGLVDRFKEMSAKFSYWFSMTTIIMRIVTGLRQMVTNVKEIDAAMVSLKKVTDETAEGYRRFFDEASKGAKKLSISIVDLINASADFARLGYNTADAEKLGELATVYKNVSEYENINEASESIISTMKAFKEGATDIESATRAINAFNEVGNNFAISSQGIGEAMKRSASAMHVAGNDLAKSIALTTGANTIIQDPDVVGTALKSLSLRITSTKTELEELGESTEYACETLSEYRDKALAITANTTSPVDIMNEAKDGYKDTYTIITDIAKIWCELNQQEQAALEKMFAGRQQANVFAALVENFDIVEQAYTTATEAINEGTSAMKEQAKWQEGLEAKTNNVSVAFQSLSENIFPKETLGKFLDAETGILNFTDKIVKSFGGLSLIIGAIGTSLLKAKVEIDGTGRSISLVGIKIKELRNNAGTMQFPAFDKAKADIESYNGAVMAGVNSTDALTHMFEGNATNALGKFTTTLNGSVTSIRDYGAAIGRMTADSGNLNNIINGFNSFNAATVEGKVAQQAFVSEIQKTNPVMAKYLSGLNGASATMSGYTAAEKQARLAAIGLKIETIALNTALTMGLGFAISGIIKLCREFYDNVISATGAVNKLKEASDNYSQSAQKIEELREKYQKLLTSEESEAEKQKALIEIKKQLVEAYGYEAEAIREVNGLREEGLGIFDKEAAREAQKNIADIEASLGKVSESVQKKFKYVASEFVYAPNAVNGNVLTEGLSEELRKYWGTQYDYERGILEIGLSFKEVKGKEALGIIEKMKQELVELQMQGKASQYSPQMIKALDDYEAYLNKKIGENVTQYEDSIKSLGDSLVTIFEADHGQLNDIANSSKNAFEAYKTGLLESIDNLSLDDYSKQMVTDYLETVLASARVAGTNIETEVVDPLDRITAKIEESKKLLADVPNDITKAAENLEKIDKLIETNNDADKFFGVKEMDDAINMYPELYDKIVETAYGYKFEEGALEELRKTRAKEKQETLNAELEKARAVAQSAKIQLENYLSITKTLGNPKEIILRTRKAATANSALDELGKVIDAYQTRIDNLDDQFTNIKDTNADTKDLLDKQKDALDKQKDDLEKMKDDYEDAQKKINSLLELTMSYIKKQKELEKEALKDKLDSYKKAVDLKKKELDMEKKLHDYKDNLSEKSKAANDLKLKIDALSVEGVDYSLEDLKNKKKYQEDYVKAKKALDDVIYDHEVETRKEALETEEDLFEQKIEAQTKVIEDYLDHEGQIRSDAIAMINNKTEEFYRNLHDYTVNYTTKSDYEFQKLWNDAYDALAKYGNGQIDVSGVLAYLDYQIAYTEGQVKGLDNAITNLNNQIQAMGSTTRSAMETMRNSIEPTIGAFEKIAKAISDVQNAMKDVYTQNMGENSAMRGDPRYVDTSYTTPYTNATKKGTVVPSPATTPKNTMDIAHYMMHKVPKFHDGGLVEGEGEVFAKLMAGEVVTTANQAEKFLGETLPKLITAGQNVFAPKYSQNPLTVGDIIVNGNATQETVNQLRTIQNTIAENIFKRINTRSRNKGLGVMI